jgi:hypothetical protein
MTFTPSLRHTWGTLSAAAAAAGVDAATIAAALR